jgi:DNA-binding NarL/FixJ family response regulator
MKELQPARVLVADDHPLLREGIVQTLAREADFAVCGQAASAAEVKQMLEVQQPDLVIMDLMLRHDDGIELIKFLRALRPELRILVISMHDEKLHAERVLRAGAQGFLSKHEAPECILEAARAVLAGEVWLSRAMSTRLIRKGVGLPGADVAKPPPLSDRELHIFELLGTGVKSGEIARDLQISAKTVQAHRENIKIKLQLCDGEALLQAASRWVREGRWQAG